MDTRVMSLTPLGKYMRARRKMDSVRGYKLWDILSRDDFVLGKVCWYMPWRQYVFEPASSTSFNATCLTELRTFLSAETTKKLHPSRVYDEIDAITGDTPLTEMKEGGEVLLGAEIRKLGLTGEGEGNY